VVVDTFQSFVGEGLATRFSSRGNSYKGKEVGNRALTSCDVTLRGRTLEKDGRGGGRGGGGGGGGVGVGVGGGVSKKTRTCRYSYNRKLERLGQCFHCFTEQCNKVRTEARSSKGRQEDKSGQGDLKGGKISEK